MPLAKRLGRVIYCANPRQISRRATATHRPGEGYTAPGNTRGNSSSDEYRVVVDYPIRLL
ncbi:hypothetical protein APB68_33650 [Pseudomonas aeruginosa]|nr:hypothetical protein APB66_34285 [Pseudomonas aeruginosa]OPE40744.1 hypothetical protein APB68_33650 [Pseudomonas aeruginosa]